MLTELLKSIPVLLFVVFFTFTFWLIKADKRKKRNLKVKPKITVVIPCYNDEKFIWMTIKSIISSYKDLELIVINDKSTDNSKKVIEELQKEHWFIFVDNEENKWKVKSLNDAVDIATNEIIFFVDSDTQTSNDSFVKCLERLKEENVWAVSCPNRVLTKWFLPAMQQIEYNLISLIRFPVNVSSC